MSMVSLTKTSRCVLYGYVNLTGQMKKSWHGREQEPRPHDSSKKVCAIALGAVPFTPTINYKYNFKAVLLVNVCGGLSIIYSMHALGLFDSLAVNRK